MVLSLAGAARPLVHKIVAVLLMEGCGEVGGNIHVPPFLRRREGAPKLTRSFGNSRRGTFRNAYLTQKLMCRFFSKFVCVLERQRPKTTPQIQGKVLFS